MVLRSLDCALSNHGFVQGFENIKSNMKSVHKNLTLNVRQVKKGRLIVRWEAMTLVHPTMIKPQRRSTGVDLGFKMWDLK